LLSVSLKSSQDQAEGKAKQAEAEVRHTGEKIKDKAKEILE
jgi:uncharacterized protein YjbJ (UPF0337 family)